MAAVQPSLLPNGDHTISPLQGAKLYLLKVNRDSRGELTALEQDCNLPFSLKRIFFVSVESTHVTRAEHACSAEQVIVAVRGTVTVDLNNGHEQSTFDLDRPDHALWIQRGMWVRLRNFGANTLLMVAASQLYRETEYYALPQPDLIAITNRRS